MVHVGDTTSYIEDTEVYSGDCKSNKKPFLGGTKFNVGDPTLKIVS